MKLLFDENLSPKLSHLLAESYPGCTHVRDCGLTGKSDQEIWDYAQQNGFTLVSKDSDFYQRCLFLGAPPKLIWVCIGNCTRTQVMDLLLKHETDIRSLETANETILILT